MPVQFSMQRDPNAGLLPDGVYRFIVEAAQEKKKAGGEYPYVELRIRPIVKGQKWGSSAFDRISSSPAARFRVDSFMDAVGAPNEPGSAGVSWFIGKSGWAKFKMGETQDGEPRLEVGAYMTEERAEKFLAKQAEADGSEGAMTVSTSRSSRPAPDLDDDEPVVRRKSNTGRTKAAVAELDDDTDEDVPF